MSISPSFYYMSFGICLLVIMFPPLSPFYSPLSKTFINAELTDDPVTCGSFLKLSSMVGTANKKNTFWLHSHAIQWATGSGQQSVTAHGGAADIDNMWLVKEADPSKTKVACITGTPIKCGDVVRLQHVTTSSNLHSHLFRSPLSGQQEVSCFGTSDQKMGLSDGDTGDNWIVMCDITKEGTGYWKRNQHVGLKHADTGKYLATHKRFRFDNSNCPNCPINGQIEVMATAARRDSGIDFKWKADLGIYFHQDDEDSLQDEL